MKSTRPIQEQQFSIVRIALGFFIQFFLWAMFGAFITLIISCLLMTRWGQESAFHYINGLIQGQFIYYSHSIYSSVFGESLPRLLTSINSWSQWTIPVNADFLNELKPIVQPSQNNLATDKILNLYIMQGGQLFSAHIHILLLTLQLLFFRFILIFGAAPLFIVFGSVGIIEGLKARDIRRWSGGRESTLIYHRAKRYIPLTVFMSIFIYLVLPMNINPQWIFVPGALLFSITIAITLRSFKKYV